MDRFKEVNDLFGHEVGDQLLGLLGKRLQQLSDCYEREGSSWVETIEAFRFGGDEFCFWCGLSLNRMKSWP
ncbi:MAG: diguanylate cyclase [Thiolinea sp.]